MHMSIDEHMIPSWQEVNSAKMFLQEPNPLGLKNFFLAAIDGLVLDLNNKQM